MIRCSPALAVACIGLAFLFLGCGIPSPRERLDQARLLVSHAGGEQGIFPNASFDLFTWHRYLDRVQGRLLRVYIEGDGLAWRTPRQISEDPTPLNPLGLKLALQDPTPSLLYLARPCQFIRDPDCGPKDWTSHRFSPQVLKAFTLVLDGIKKRYKPSGFVLFGYSGGGGIAALLAAHRSDVAGLVTIAGNLDIEKWVQIHGLTPLDGSLNPADYTKALEKIPQYHWVGGQDRILGPAIYKSFEDRFVSKENLHSKVHADHGHSRGWEAAWKDILKNFEKWKK